MQHPCFNCGLFLMQIYDFAKLVQSNQNYMNSKNKYTIMLLKKTKRGNHTINVKDG
jgi:hypothetical protein